MITLLTAIDLELHYNQKTFLNRLNFILQEGDVIGLVGRNGCGKSSLLKILAGETDYDGGKIETKKDVKIGYLPQDFELNLDFTVDQQLDFATAWIIDLIKKHNSLLDTDPDKHDLMEKISRHHGWDLQNHITDLCNKFGVNSFRNSPKNLFTKTLFDYSGGEQRRIALVCALVGTPDILILDEPTNHLDLGTIEVLEKVIKSYTGAILMVSHDRYFLDNVATKMWELWQGSFFVHNGGYSKYLENKALRLEIENSTDWKKQQFLKRELEWVRAGVKARSTKDKGRLKRFYDLKETAGVESDLSVEMVLPEPKVQGSRILEMEKVFFYLDTPDKPKLKEDIVDNKATCIVHDFTFSFQKGQKIGVLGNNGVGKTTFLRILMDQLKPDKGTIKIGSNTEFLYFNQKKVDLNIAKTAFDELGDGSEYMKFGETQLSVRRYLEAWLFDKKKYNTAIKHLSGGEKSRLILAKILAKGGNFLVLDEPTNDLDLDTLRVLEESLLEFEGTAMIVSHDRYFLNRVCNYVMAFEGNGAISISTGNYDQYLGKKIDPMLIRSYREAVKLHERQQKQNKKDTTNLVAKLEEDIAKAEVKIEELKKPFEDGDFYIKEQVRALRLHKMINDWERELDRLMKKWESLLEGGIDSDEVMGTGLTMQDIFIKPKPKL
jgi:ABC transport system ATP-binding/permease protein